MGTCLSSQKVSGSNSNATTTTTGTTTSTTTTTTTSTVNHNRKAAVSEQRTTATKVAANRQESSQHQRHNRKNETQKNNRNSQQLNIKDKHNTRRSGVIPCGKRTDFGYAKDFDKRYTIGKLLGHGQFGYTYVATDKANGDRVAVKRIEKNKVWLSPSFLSPFLSLSQSSFVFGVIFPFLGLKFLRFWNFIDLL